MGDGGCKRSEADAISHGKEGAQIERAFLLVCRDVELEVRVYNAGDVVALASGREETVGENGEGLGIVEVEPVGSRGDDVHDDNKAGGDVGGGEPGAGEGAAEVRGDGGPVEADGADAEAVEAGAELLGEDGVGKDPADPREGGEHGEEVAREHVVGEATDESYHEELVTGEATLWPLLLLVECPEEKSSIINVVSQKIYGCSNS